MEPGVDSRHDQTIPEREPEPASCGLGAASVCTLPAGNLPAFAGQPFDQIPAACRVRVFGVDYARLSVPSGGQLYVTRHGWPCLAALLPEQWYVGKRYLKQGRRLAGSTSAIHKVTSAGGGHCRDLVVKFCRFAQDVPLSVSTAFAPGITGEAIDAARFNGPFEEFGLVMDLRRGRFGPPGLRILTKRPLAIYCPPERFNLWQLGRTLARVANYQHDLELDQQHFGGTGVRLDETRMYVLLFGWVDGENAQELFEQGLMTDAELHALTHRVTNELSDKGFCVLDNKPKHFILRRRQDGTLLRRHGELVYLLVDFELLKRTPEYEAFLARQHHGNGHGLEKAA